MTSLLLRTLLISQIICALLFFIELGVGLSGIRRTPIPWEFHEIVEIAIFIAMLIGLFMSVFVLFGLFGLIKRNKKVEDQLLLAGGDLQKLLETRFAQWQLSPAESTAALMAIKGLSNAEIARVLGKSESTIKTQNAAVYQKAKVNGRTQLISTLLEDILDVAINNMQKADT